MDGKISIIVPVYNAEKKLGQCIESLINQTYKNIEIILINDGSTDNSKEVCDKYKKLDNRIITIHKANEGVSKTRNLGIKKSTGEVIMFVDSDDYIEESCCEEAFKQYSKNKSHLVIWGYNNKSQIHQTTTTIFSNEEEVSILALSNFLDVKCRKLLNSPCNKLYSVHLIKSNKLLFKEDLSLAEDLLFNLNYLDYMDEQGKLVIINKGLYNYNDDSEQSLSKLMDDEYINYRSQIYDKLFALLQKYTDLNEEIMNKYYTLRKISIQKVIVNISSSRKLSFKDKYARIKRVIKTDEYSQCINNCKFNKSAGIKKMLLNLKSPIISMLFIK